ncbi:MAG: phosphate ABC transporter permease PstA [Rhizobiales bacterium]|nr:phosphate ABC transporter permease PstA [Hyphomicrobiales bacterium]
MTDIADPGTGLSASSGGLVIKPRRLSPEASAARTKKRYAAERRFKAIGLAGVVIALGLLALLLFTIVSQGIGAFWQTTFTLPVELSAEEIDPEGTRDPQALSRADYAGILNDALYAMFPGVEDRRERRALRGLISNGASIELYEMVRDDPDLIGTTQELTILASDDVDQFVKGHVDRESPESDRRIKDQEIAWIDRLAAEGRVQTQFNTWLLTNGDSREPEMAGIWGAVVGSFYMMVVVLVLSVPLGVGAAIYLEEFAPQNNRWVDLIEVNINNLAAVPSIVFGLLGLAIFLGFFGLPRSAPLVGGMVLALMTLPTVIIAGRAAIRSVPPSIREAALGVGASQLQCIFHHVLPLAMPGIMTGTILGMARALGETAPLLMIGMVAFIVDVPSGPLQPATALPVQVYLWAESPERAFVSRTSAAILVLLGFLVLMNLTAVLLRNRFERRW